MTRPLLRPLALILFTIFLSFTARAQTHELVLVKDINTTQSGVGYVGNGTVWNGVHYFTGNDGSTGNELWRSDGTEEGTWKVKDILPPPGASPLFFGTPEVRVVASLPASLLLHVTQVQGGTTTYELWRTDGTSAGTVKVADLPYGTPAQAQTVGGQCFFLLQPSGLFIGPPLGSTWLRTDGTAAGTVVLPVNSEPIVQQVLAGGNACVLTRTGGGFSFPPQPMNYKLRRSDGTVAGTALVKDLGISTGFALPTLAALGSKVIFDFDSGTMGAGRELWSSDGTEAGTVLLKNIAPAGGSSDPAGFAVYNGAIFFSADDGTSGRELWKSDGTEAGTVRVADIAPGATGSDPQNFTPALGGLCFTADDGTHGRELWRTDGTEAGTQLLADVVPGAVGSQPDSLHEWKGRLYFSAYPGGTTGTAVVLWVTDGTVAGTHAVTDFAPASGVNVTGSSLLAVNDSFAVVLAVLSQPAGAGVTGFEWWALTGDGTTATRIAASLPLGSNAFLIPAPSASAIGSGRVVFSVRDTAHGTEMWSTDGTLAGTRITKDINTITDAADPGWLGEANGRLLFAANDGTHGREVWSSDGTTAGTRIEADIQPGIGDSSPSYGVNFQGEVYFNASDTPGTSGLWKSNGLPGGTASVASLPTSIYQPMLPLGGSLLMPLGELWKSDGSGAGTGLLKDIAPGGDSFPAALARVGSEVFFVPYSPLATSNSTGPTNQLWKTDGTASGTVLVKDFAVFTAPERSFANSPVMPLIAGSGGVYFQIITSPTSDGSPSAEVWQSDGTDAGTVIFSTGNVVNSPKAVEMLAEIGARTIFIGWDADHGSELWAKDSGTSALLRDFFLGTDNPPITVVRTEA
ncbi:MAG: ELWxxDGT repeat protein, partial [Chthoniobacteraceae bacterium]